MKIFFSENQPDYSTYTFNYTIYCVKEQQGELPEIYNKGFLPYTGNTKIKEDIFYLARSLRVNLSRFEDSRENRRICRKTESLDLKMQLTPKSAFNYDDPEFLAFCMDYASNRFSGNAMNEDRFKYVLNRQTGSHIFTFTSEEKVLGYILAALEGNTLHYWYAFFDQEYMRSHSLGKWMMWRAIKWAKEEGLEYVYLGTCYGSHSLYKVRDFKGIEFFDGSKWNPDAALLKHLCKTDHETINKDRFKLLEEPNEFLERLTEMRSEKIK